MNVMDLLGAMVQTGIAPSSERRAQQALGVGGGGIQDVLGELLGGGRAAAGSAGSVLEGFMGRAQGAVGGGQNLAGMGMGALLGSLLGGGKSSALGGVGGGLMGLLGAMAFKALRDAGQNPKPPVAIEAPRNEAAAREVENTAQLILTAMIDAAKADGQIDAEELNRITGKMKEAGIGQEGMNYIVAQLQRPMQTDAIVSSVRGRPELAAQVYSASLMSIEVDTPQERAYLDDLAARMGLSRAVAQNIEQIVGMRA